MTVPPASHALPFPYLWPDTALITSAGHLSVGGCDVVELARRYGTPLYLFDEATIRAICRAYRAACTQAYAGPVELHYASKALLNTTIAALVADEGLGLDVVSGGELYVALRAGVAPERIRLHGNAKPRVELEQAIAAGVGQIVIDNLDELATLACLAADRAAPLSVGLRLTPNIVPDTHHHIQTGQADSKFGLPLDALEAAGAMLRGAAGLRLVALHAHLGSQIVDAEPYRAAAGVLLDCALRLRAAGGLSVEEINLGGGLGVPYAPDDPQPDLGAYARAIATALTDGCAARGLPLPRLALEPGRSIVARAGVAVYEVIGRKPLPAGYGAAGFIHIDGGMADNIRPALYGARYWALLANRAAEPRSSRVHVSGRYCESGDILMRDLDLPETVPGDLLAVAVSGAYTLSMASNYNLVPRPAALLLRDGAVHVAQRRETYDDLLARDSPL